MLFKTLLSTEKFEYNRTLKMALLYTAQRNYLYKAHLQMLPDHTLP